MRLAITSTARSDRRIVIRAPGVGVDASSASADPARGPWRSTTRSCQTPGEEGLSEADRIHDSLGLGRSVLQRPNFWRRVRQPDPGLIEQGHATERGELLNERLELGEGPGQLDVADERPDEDQLNRTVAEHLIRQAQIASLCVRHFRHGIDHTDPGHVNTDFGAVACRCCSCA